MARPSPDEQAHRRFRGTVAVLGIAAAALLAGACGGSDESASDTTGPPDIDEGEQVYADRCAACHGRDFEGSAQAPSQLDPHFAPEVTSDEDYRRAISEGADVAELDYTAMPALNLDAQQITDVIAYIRSVQEERGFDRP